jgi:hypothetical protein
MKQLKKIKIRVGKSIVSREQKVFQLRNKSQLQE